MRFDVKRIGALLLALMLVIGSLPGLGVAAAAEETAGVVQTDSYVLQYEPGELTGDYPYNHPYMYTTPFMVRHTITYDDWSEYYSGGNFPEVFNLINTTKLAGGGEGAYASITAYCTDASTGIRENASYRRINLEDSTYYQSGAAGRIRAVVMNGFPMKDTNALQIRANEWLRQQGMPEIVDLQSGEAILATQIAIWKLANGEHYTIDEFYYGREDLTAASWSGYLAQVVDPSAAYQEETEHTGQNVQSLFHYLCNLPPMAPKYDAVSEASFENPGYSAVKDGDGSYTITVSVYVNTMLGANDELVISATCGDQIQSQTVTAADTYRFTFEKVPERMEVKLEINGYQSGGDVYLFDAKGDRGASQTLVGYDSSRLPVHGEITVTPDRVLNIYKSTSEENGKMPLANISFDIYRVATMSQLENGEVTLQEQPTEEEMTRYQIPENYVATVITDVRGFASYNFTDNNQPDGVYLIVEQFSTATTGTIHPFYVAVPATTEDGSGYSYSVNVNPKNATESGPDIQKDVTKPDNNSDSFDVGQVHTWIIRSDIPAGIGNAQKYVITDVMDYRLTYQQGSPEVKLYCKDGTHLALEAGVHYTLTEGLVTVDGREVDRLSIALTKDGMSFVAANLGNGEEKAELRVYFKAIINEHAEMGTTIPNSARVDYTNSAGVEYDDISDVPEVHTGGINILKTDAAAVPLAGATFKIARLATDEELKEESVRKEILNVGGEELSVVFVDFHATASMSGVKVSEVTTDDDGKAVIYGLAYGTYYLVETKAPAGYNLLSEPIVVQINEVSHLTSADSWEDADGQIVDNTLHVINTRFILPETGGVGTAMFTVTGIAIIAAACMLLLTNRRKRV